MQNLLKETLQDLEYQNKTPSDVRWVGSHDGEYAISWEEFTAISNFTYDNGFGSTEIDLGLVVVGDDWWLERSEYDGLEGWEFKKLPVKSENPTKFNKVRYEIKLEEK